MEKLIVRGIEYSNYSDYRDAGFIASRINDSGDSTPEQEELLKSLLDLFIFLIPVKRFAVVTIKAGDIGINFNRNIGTASYNRIYSWWLIFNAFLPFLERKEPISVYLSSAHPIRGSRLGIPDELISKYVEREKYKLMERLLFPCNIIALKARESSSIPYLPIL